MPLTSFSRVGRPSTDCPGAPGHNAGVKWREYDRPGHPSIKRTRGRPMDYKKVEECQCCGYLFGPDDTRHVHEAAPQRRQRVYCDYCYKTELGMWDEAPSHWSQMIRAVGRLIVHALYVLEDRLARRLGAESAPPPSPPPAKTSAHGPGGGRLTMEQHGFVNFPTSDDGYRETGEGGMAVYAFFRRTPEICITGATAWVTGDVVFWDPVDTTKETGPSLEPRVRGIRVFDDDMPEGMRIPALPVAGYVYLGSTGASLFNDYAAEYFRAERGDLTPAGLAFLAPLEDLYGQQAAFVTFLDT